MNRTLHVALCTLHLFVAACLPVRLPDIFRPTDGAVVARIVDGDTIDIAIEGRNERVRLLGINAPETSGQPECFGPEAAQALRLILPARAPITLERDSRDRDQFGRLLRYVRGPDGDLVNVRLVREGFAEAATGSTTDRYAAQLIAAQEQARAAGLGLWGACRRSSEPGTGQASVRFVEVIGGPPGSRATVTVQTVPGAQCDIEYTTPAGSVSRASGLGVKTAESAGRVTWTFNIDSNTRPGNGLIAATCAGITITATIVIAER